MFDLGKIVDELYRPARGDENLHATGLRLSESVDGSLWNAMRAKAHQRAVNVEK
jgi:hypothetical protein